MTAAARWAEYTGSGGIWSWKTGFDWQAVDALRLRATVSRDVRAANMSERYDAAGAGATIMDPVFGNQSVTFTQVKFCPSGNDDFFHPTFLKFLKAFNSQGIPHRIVGNIERILHRRGRR